MGPICSTFVHSQILLHCMCKIDSQSDQPFDHNFPVFWIVDPIKPPTMPPWVIVGLIVWAYVHSQMNPQTWTKGGANRTASQDFWIVDPLKPLKCPLVSRGAICLGYINSHMNLHVCQIWCRSAQPFGSFSRICAKVSSAFRRCMRWLAQKHAKKQHLYI